MIILLGLSSVACGLIGLFCFVGLLFIGKPIPTIAAMGVCGVASAVCGLALTGGRTAWAKPTMAAGGLGVLAVAADIAYYYKYLASPGNYYAWFVFVPYAAALALVAACGFFVRSAPDA